MILRYSVKYFTCILRANRSHWSVDHVMLTLIKRLKPVYSNDSNFTQHGTTKHTTNIIISGVYSTSNINMKHMLIEAEEKLFVASICMA